MRLGATYLSENQTEFLLYAPYAEAVELVIGAPGGFKQAMLRQEKGYFHCIAQNVPPGSLYWYRFNQQCYADPASRFQPEGIFGPSQVIDACYSNSRSIELWPTGDAWGNNAARSERARRVARAAGPVGDQSFSGWRGLALSQYIIYEVHVGTFTSEGTFAALMAKLDWIGELGVTAIELMPVAQFPGDRNWGYDGVFPFAVQNSYGTPEQLKALVQACHQRGLAVILDVVYNHVGPEGNHFNQFGPYFTERYHTPWGAAINFDGPSNHEIRRFFIENALMWVGDYHIDALRLDALHAVFDYSADPFLAELAEQVHHFARQTGRFIYLFAEAARNDLKFVHRKKQGGYGLDVQWNEDFHHALHAVLTGERSGYYQDFGQLAQLAKAFKEGYVLTERGQSSAEVAGEKFLVFGQNHDQIGNRMLGERFTQLLNFAQRKLAASVILLSPYIPLLFMGEEYGEEARFWYFISHANPNLIQAVREGRRKEFSLDDNSNEMLDPQAIETFIQSKLHHHLRQEDWHKPLYTWYQQLISYRKNIPTLAHLDKINTVVRCNTELMLMTVHRWHQSDEVFIVFFFVNTESKISITTPPGVWHKILDSEDREWGGNGSSLPPKISSETQLILRAYVTAIYRKT